MAKKPANHGKPITRQVVAQVRAIAAENNISLKPTNQSPYNRRKG